MAIVAVDLGSSPTGAGGDTNREAFTKLNTSVSELDARASISLERVAGDAGFVNAAGAVTLNLNSGRHFHSLMTGEITSLAFTNVPTTTAYSASWTWVLRIDATGGYPLASPPAVTFVDGRSFDDADLSANAENVFTFWQVGTIVYGALITNGTITFDPYVLSFPADGTQLVAITRAETLDLANVTNLEADGTAGTGTLTFKKNGGANISVATAFAVNDVLTVTLASAITASAVSIPRLP